MTARRRDFSVRAFAALCMLWLLLFSAVKAQADEACPSPTVLLGTEDVQKLARLLGESGRIHIPICTVGFVEVAAAGRPLCRAGKSTEVTRIGVQIRAEIDRAFGAAFVVRKNGSARELATDVVGEQLL